ncbi:GGDEF domain-containing protein [Cellulomonas carbonis]|uniref:GGDEF domain-containing protein n=1 Tax=Cellulomonas carbonis T26 TaxID=947969 RepID=A0A0A0BLY6_9CELL|nr:GGDEF domain-containing protein [Cellulomonas carbonis]KGM09533.1 hypothetical protein N868_01525 [Cellulomonas carbonis T26]GGB95547.1 diguanylate cyclase [Cellulomonas carbonis]
MVTRAVRSTALDVRGEFGPWDALADAAHAAYVDGFSEDAVLLCRHGLALAVAADDVVTARYLRYVEAVALQELGRHADAVVRAQELLASLGDEPEPVWRAKALSIVSEASGRIGGHGTAMAAIAEADWLRRRIPVGTYGHLSASMAVALALRSVNLLEEADAALSAVRGGGGPGVDVLVWQELGLLSAHWGTSLVLLERDREAGSYFVLTASRSRRMRRAAARVGDERMAARSHVIESYAMMRLGEVELAAARCRAAAGSFSARAELVETHLVHLVMAADAERRGDYAAATTALETMLADADDAGHELWSQTATVALARVHAAEHGTSRGADLWRGLAVAGLHKVWSEREARFAALNDRHHLRELTDRSERAGAEALQDSLTGLGNRRALERVLAEGAPQRVVFIDVDDFKSVNDRWSHAVGDAVLRRLGELLRSVARADDVLVRYGGDEFLVLPVGDADAAHQVARRVRRAVLDHDWGQVASGLTVTVSVGVGAADGLERDALASADAAVLESKRRGRNRVTVAPHG